MSLPGLFIILPIFLSDYTSKRDRENWIEIQSFQNDTFRVDPELKEQADFKNKYLRIYGSD
jgi:hypothetical protein